MTAERFQATRALRGTFGDDVDRFSDADLANAMQLLLHPKGSNAMSANPTDAIPTEPDLVAFSPEQITDYIGSDLARQGVEISGTTKKAIAKAIEEDRIRAKKLADFKANPKPRRPWALLSSAY